MHDDHVASRPSSELVSTFLEEHRGFMRGLSDILKNLQSGDLMAARQLADALDRTAGAHIQFEEEVLYPEVGRVRGRSVERELRGEHDDICRALKRLREADVTKGKLDDLRKELVESLQTGLRHAESCGTLISHLKFLEPSAQRAALAQLRELRAQGLRWTELPRQDEAHASPRE